MNQIQVQKHNMSFIKYNMFLIKEKDLKTNNFN